MPEVATKSVERFTCRVCDCDQCGPDDLVDTVVALFDSNGKRIEGWDYRVWQCKDCLNKLGRPLQVFSYRHLKDVADFQKAPQVELKGSHFSD